jgi:hypothetical protein
MSWDPRAEELNNLRLALATFALQLDAFEARLKGRQGKSTAEPPRMVSPAIGFASQAVAPIRSLPSTPPKAAS